MRSWPVSSRPAVLLVGDTLGLGGTEGQFAEIACRADRGRWAVHVSCLRAEGPRRATLDAAGVPVWSCGRGSFRPSAFARALMALVREMRARRIRVVHTFDFYSNLLGIAAARVAGIQAIIASQRNLGGLRPPWQEWMQRQAIRRAARLLVNSPAIAERVAACGAMPASRVVVVPNGVDVARFASVPRPRTGDAVVVGTLANLRPEKGLGDFVAAAALVHERYPRARFVVFGDGALRTALRADIEARGLGAAMSLPGTAPSTTALAAIDVFVLPSVSEGFSNALLEAMAAGRPAIATRVGGNVNVLRHEDTGLLVDAADPGDLAKAMLRVIEDPSLAGGLAERGRRHVAAELGMARMLARVESLWDDVLAGEARG
jgi:glycosyltransferase involved in cell wall biosynthesis